MDKKERVLLILLIVLYLISSCVAYWKYIVKNDYEVEVPSDPSLFVHDT